MTGIRFGLALVAALMMLAPLAAADAAESGNDGSADGSAERPDDAAWVEDCPPDMMCAAGTEDDGNAWVEDCPPDMMCAFDDGNTTRGPEDCEFCRYGPDDCIECSGPSTPVDDTTWGTDCPEGVYCFGDGPSEPPVCEGGPCEYDPAPQETDTSTEEAPAPLLTGVLLAVFAVALVALRRRA